MNNIILMGPPGAGKGTQSKLIAKEKNLIHISTGDLIREEQKNNTPIGQLATRLSDNGNFLPNDIVISIIKQKIIDNLNADGFIFDGFPRTVEQAKALDEFLHLRQTPISKVILIKINDSIIEKRILERAEKENRPDDNKDVIKTRMVNYRSETMPVVEYFRTRREIIEIDGDKTVDEVYSILNSSC